MDSYLSVKLLEKNHYEVGNMWLCKRGSVEYAQRLYDFLVSFPKEKGPEKKAGKT